MGQSGKDTSVPWKAVCDHTGVPELRVGEPRKGKEKSGKSGKKKGQNAHGRKLYP